jgi:uncharacterized cupin superfamily protein
MEMDMSVHVMVPEQGEPVTPISEGWEVLEGDPVMWTWFEHQSKDKTIVEGTWRCTPGTLRAEYKYYEYVVMLEGVIEITPDAGETVVVKAGDAFAVEADFKGVWKVIEPVHKRFLLRLA